MGSSNFTYGEVVCETFLPVLALAEPKAGETFWDLGCGSGVPLAVASLAYPYLKACKGVELLDQVYELCAECT